MGRGSDRDPGAGGQVTAAGAAVDAASVRGAARPRYDGAHDSVHRFTRVWREEQARVPQRAYVPLSFAPGEAYQFDWSHEMITLSGCRW